MADRFAHQSSEMANPIGVIKDKSDMARNFSTMVNEPTFTSQQALLSLELLKETLGDDDASKTLIKTYAQQETKYIRAAMQTLQDDKLLAAQMGGVSMANALKLADVLHRKTVEKEIENMLDERVKTLIPTIDRTAIGKAFKAPVVAPSASL